MEKSHGELVYLMTRYLNLCIAEAPTWQSEELLAPPVIKELKFWRENLRKENGQAINTPIISNRITYSDASSTGSAAIVTGGPCQKDYIVTKFFNQEEKAGSSTERELLGILHGIIAFKHLLQNQAVTWHTDCKNLVRIVKRGSTKPYILNLAIAVYHVTKQNNILLNVVWIPRKENEQADFFSRVIDYNDWGISSEWFDKICLYCKVIPSFDRFADQDNKKCTLFNSRFYHNQSEGVDAFTYDWSDHVNWVVPPIFLVNRAIDYAELCQAEIILVVPLWKSAVFWPKINTLMTYKNHIIKHKMILGNIFSRGRTNTSIFGSPDWKGNSMVLHIKF